MHESPELVVLGRFIKELGPSPSHEHLAMQICLGLHQQMAMASGIVRHIRLISDGIVHSGSATIQCIGNLMQGSGST